MDRSSDTKPPRFSVIVPALDAAEFIGEAIDSVRAQTQGDWELIVVDDGSADDTYRIACEQAAADPRITVLKEEDPRRLRARATAAAHARAEWLVRFDADDIMEPGYLEHMTRFMDANPGYDIYSCNGTLFGQDCTWPFVRGRASRRPGSATLDDMLLRDRIFGMAVIRRKVYEAAGGFRDGVYRDDYDFWLRAMARGARHRYNPEFLGRYRQRPGQRSADAARMRASTLDIYENLLAEPALTRGQRAYITARLGREGVQTRMAGGDFRRTRRDHWRYRRGYADRAKYWTTLPLMLANPKLYWRLYHSRRPLGW